MGQYRSHLSDSIYKCIENKEWQELLDLLQSGSSSDHCKRSAILGMKQGPFHSRFLILVSSFNAPIDVVKAALDLCGKPLVFQTNKGGFGSLHSLAKCPIDRLELLLSVGGRELLNSKANGMNPLHYAIMRKAGKEELELFIRYGGTEILLEKEEYHERTSLHLAMHCSCSSEVLITLINSGGRELVTSVDRSHFTPFDYFVSNRNRNVNVSERGEILKLFIQTIGFDDSAGRLFQPYPGYLRNRAANSIAPFVIRNLLGGIHNVDTNEEHMTTRWSQIYSMDDFSVFFLASIAEVFKDKPFLQKAIGYTTRNGIVDIIDHFENCATIRDSNDELPIEVAVKKNLKWDDGLKDILEITVASDKYERSALMLSCTYGLKWNNGMDQIVNCRCYDDDELYKVDAVYGLYPVLLLATCENAELQGIFELVREAPFICK